MATTSIWAVKGWLGKVVLYIENPDKTDNPKFYRQEELTDVQTQNLSDVIDYAVRAEKTTVTPDDESAMVVRQFISGINCLPSTARDEMLAVKKRFGKEDGVIAYHGYQSFAPGEATPELAHEIGVKLAQRLWDERYQVLVATHLDKIVCHCLFPASIFHIVTLQDHDQINGISIISAGSSPAIC